MVRSLSLIILGTVTFGCVYQSVTITNFEKHKIQKSGLMIATFSKATPADSLAETTPDKIIVPVVTLNDGIDFLQRCIQKLSHFETVFPQSPGIHPVTYARYPLMLKNGDSFDMVLPESGHKNFFQGDSIDFVLIIEDVVLVRSGDKIEVINFEYAIWDNYRGDVARYGRLRFGLNSGMKDTMYEIARLILVDTSFYNPVRHRPARSGRGWKRL